MDDKVNKHLIVSACQLLQSLPMDPTHTDISEFTLITRYIVPLLQPLVDNDDLNIRLDFATTELSSPKNVDDPQASTDVPIVSLRASPTKQTMASTLATVK